MKKPALLMLDDGACFEGEARGACREALGEAVFTTGMCGYQETLTDPSFYGQIVTFTAAHIGNYGVTPLDDESFPGGLQDPLQAFGPYSPEAAAPSGSASRPPLVRAAGAVFHDLFAAPEGAAFPHWRATESVDAFLAAQGVTAIAGVDTRALTLHLREHGARNGIVSALDLDKPSLLRRAKALPPMQGRDLASLATCERAYPFTARPQDVSFRSAQSPLRLSVPAGEGVPPRGDLPEPSAPGASSFSPDGAPPHVAVIDYGVKRSILQNLAVLGMRVTVWPAGTGAADILASGAGGVLLSNGPGDPQACFHAVETVKRLLGRLPVFGICLGHQLLGLALGGRTYKLSFGHHGVNHPVKDLVTGRVLVTSQNHGFCVDPDSLPSGVRPSHRNLNDGTLEGLECADIPAFSVQFHPEAAPGPADAAGLFRRFYNLILQKKNGER